MILFKLIVQKQESIFSLSGNVNIAQMLVNNGADVNAKDILGATPLITAAQYG